MLTTVRSALRQVSSTLIDFFSRAVRAALRQQEHRLQEEGLRIQQLVEEFKFKQKTIGAPFEIQAPVYFFS
jgi:hypothetical protein